MSKDFQVPTPEELEQQEEKLYESYMICDDSDAVLERISFDTVKELQDFVDQLPEGWYVDPVDWEAAEGS